MLTRCISGAVLIVIGGAAILLGGPTLMVLLMVLGLIGFYELAKALGLHKEGKKVSLLEGIGYLAVVVLNVCVYFDFVGIGLGAWCTGFLLVLLSAYVLDFKNIRIEDVMKCFFAVMYAPFLLSYMYRIRVLEHGVILVFLVMITSAGNDTFAYFVGSAIGKKKLAPILSPKKSVEGSIGGILGAALLAGIYGYFVGEKTFGNTNYWWLFAIICGVGAVVAQIGDLAASGIKRNVNIKDYGKLIPGHGGIMDRLDSIIVTAPIIYYLTILILRLETKGMGW